MTNPNVPHDIELALSNLSYILNPDDKLKAYNTFEEKLLGGHFTSYGSYLSKGSRTTAPATVANMTTEAYLNKRKLDIETSGQIWNTYKADNGYGYLGSSDPKGTWVDISPNTWYVSIGGHEEYYKHLSLAIEKCNELQKIVDIRKANGLSIIDSDRRSRFWDDWLKDYQNYIDKNREADLTKERLLRSIEGIATRKYNQK